MVAAENRTFWTDKGIDPKGILRAAFSNASRQRHPGRLDDHPAVRQDPLPHPGALLHAQGQGGDPVAEDPAQQSKREILEGYLNTIYFGRGAYGVQAAAQAYFDKDAKDLNLRQSAVLASVLNNPTQLRPGQRQGRQAGAQGALRATCWTAWPTPASITAETAEKAAKRLPKFPEIEAESTYGGQRGHMLTLVRDELHPRSASPTRRSTAAACGSPRRSPSRPWTPPRRASCEARPEGFGDKELHIGVASVEPGTGALRGFYGGQDYLDSQINWAVAGGMAGSTFKPFALAAAHRGAASRSRTPSTATRPTSSPTASTSNEGQGDRQRLRRPIDMIYRDREVDQHRLHRHDRLRWPTDPQKIIDDRQRGWASRRPRRSQEVARHPRHLRRTSSPRHPASPWARPGSARSTWPTPTPPSPTAASAPTSTSSRRSSTADGEELYTAQGSDRRGHRRRHRRRHVSYALQQVVTRTAPAPPPSPSAARPPARPAPRPTARARSPRPGSSATPRSWRPR